MHQDVLPTDPPWLEADPPQAEEYAVLLNLTRGQWTYLYRSAGSIGDFSVGQYSALLTAERAAAALEGPSWEVQIGSGGPGFTQYYENGEKTAVYERFHEDGVELIVFFRDYHGVRPALLELAEEFRLFFNLWEDRPNRTYYYFDDAGNAVKAAIIEDDSVRVLTNLLRRYQAAKQMFLALYHDSTRWSDDLPNESTSWDVQTNDAIYFYRLVAGELAFASGKRFSRLFGKHVFAPPPIEKAGIWPYEKREPFETFIISVDSQGESVLFSADPDALANYFGANPGAPHYLTPVYVRKDVLNKYYSNSAMYSVEDGYLRCVGLWGLRMDNDLRDHVMVFLGDLGRDIPYSEAQYWKSFNVPPPDGGPSATLKKRAFLAEFADAESLDFVFAAAYGRTNNAWLAAFGWPLFNALHEDDRHVKANLHVPITDGQAEFDGQVLNLAKLLVDSINEEAIVAAIGRGSKNEAGLAKLERFLDSLGVPEARQLLKPFANVQGLRSRGAAHRKGSDFDLSVALGELGRREGFERLLSEATAVLDTLRETAQQTEPDSGSSE